MDKFSENMKSEQEENLENPVEKSVESPEDIAEEVIESSEEVISEGDNLLNKVAEGADVDSVDGGPELLEATQGSMEGVKQKIKDLAESTVSKIKTVLRGKKLEDMEDDELAAHLNKKRVEHQEVHDHYRNIQRGKKFDIGGFREVRAFQKRNKIKKERSQAAREADKRGLEVLTPEQQNIRLVEKISKLTSQYLKMVEGITTQDEKPAEATVLEKEINELTKQAHAKGLEVQSIHEQYLSERKAKADWKEEQDKQYEEQQKTKAQQQYDAEGRRKERLRLQREEIDETKSAKARRADRLSRTGLWEHEQDERMDLERQLDKPDLDSFERDEIQKQIRKLEKRADNRLNTQKQSKSFDPKDLR